MGSINPNPPASGNPVTEGRQFFCAVSLVPFNSNTLSVTAGNWNIPATTGAQPAVAIDTTNAVRRVNRLIRRAAAGAAADVGFYTIAGNGASADSTYAFPAQANDGGIRIRMMGGLDATVSTLASTAMMFGAVSGNFAIPSAGTSLSGASMAWIGMYTNNDGVFRFGYKNLAGAITPLGNPLATTWAPYQMWKFDIFCSPSGPTTFYSVSQMNAGGTAFVNLCSGAVSSALFNPGREGLGPFLYARKTIAGDVLDLWMNSAQLIGYPNGNLSL